MVFKGFNMTYDEVMESVNNIIPIFENSFKYRDNILFTNSYIFCRKLLMYRQNFLFFTIGK